MTKRENLIGDINSLLNDKDEKRNRLDAIREYISKERFVEKTIQLYGLEDGS